MSDATLPPADGPRRPAREDEIEPSEEMRAADRANGEPQAATTERASAGFEQPAAGTSEPQSAPVSEPRPSAEPKETP